MSRNRSSATSRTTVSKTRSALAIQSPARRRISASRPRGSRLLLIEDPAVLVGRIGDAADDVLRGLEAFGGDDLHIDREVDVTNCVLDGDALLVAVGWSCSTINRSMS